MLDFIGTIVLVAAIIVSINALTGAMPISPSQRIALSVGAGLWTGLAAALAGANLFLGTNPVGPPVIGYGNRASAGRDGRCGVDLVVCARFAARDADALPDRSERLARRRADFSSSSRPKAGLPDHFRTRRAGAIS